MSVEMQSNNPQPLIDPFGRKVDYLRVSVTDRCDLRCVYCMKENQKFLPRADLLTIEELERLCNLFIASGTQRIRLTGGEPLLRRGIMDLITQLGRQVQRGALAELTLTTNGTRLVQHAQALVDNHVRRINVSLDSRDPEKFRHITRGGDVVQVLNGIKAAQAAGLSVKLNMVALKGVNEGEIADQIQWAHEQGMAITLIETMPMGEVEEDRTDQYLPLDRVRSTLSEKWTLTPLTKRTAGPARYVRVEETGGELGFITPLTHNFCESCNRVRLTCTGTLFMCLGQNDAAELREPLRAHADDDQAVLRALHAAIARKPKGHDFHIDRKGQAPAVPRPMSMTGG